jgi:hypothetical protein
LCWLSESETQSVGDGKEGNKKPGGSDTIIIKPHEQRALNFLINEYLLVRGYKLTSITFADENEDQVSVFISILLIIIIIFFFLLFS